MAKILVIDDNGQIRRAIGKFLEKAGHEAELCANGQSGLEALSDGQFDVVISDLKMPVMTGIEFLEEAKKAGFDVPVILLTAHGSIASAVEAMKLGASDYLSKPLEFPELSIRIERLLETSSLRAENRRLKSELKNTHGFDGIIGNSRAMERMFETVRPLASDRDISVLLNGETGTGKELIAKSIHYTGPRAEKPFVAINCGALPEHLLESELFGHEKGSFTDARQKKIGLFETADGGTLFLDEIDSMPLDIQVKLLRAIEERTIRRVGGNEDIRLDIRLIAAANSTLEGLVESGDFRADLYFRIAVAPVPLPPLRKRDGDIILLARHFADKKSSEKSKGLAFSKQVLECFAGYRWPGNVRELENLIELLTVTNQNGRVEIGDLPRSFRRALSESPHDLGSAENQDLKMATKRLIEDFEREFILKKLDNNRWNISRTAEEIGLSRTALHTKIKQLQLRG